MPKPIIIGNWKMNGTLAESKELVRQLNILLSPLGEVDVVVCPPYTALQAVAAEIQGHLFLGAQNVHPALQGAFTGEISAPMLQNLSCRFVLVGHSERRQLLGENNDFIANKVRACVEAQMTPVLCVGESLAQRQAGQGAEVVLRQLKEGLMYIGHRAVEIMIAYEPVWAIGTGHAAFPHEVAEILHGVAQVLGDVLPTGSTYRLLYGGSVTPENIKDYVSQEIIHGALVGGVSLKADQFAAVVRSTCETKRGN